MAKLILGFAKSFLFLPFIFMYSPSASASNTQFGQVFNLLVIREGKLFFSVNASKTLGPACATSSGRYVIDMTVPGGQIIASTVLTAFSTGKAISVAGTNACQDWGDTESVSNVFIP